MIKSIIVLEDTIISMTSTPNAAHVTVTVSNPSIGKEETNMIDADDFAASLTFALSPDEMETFKLQCGSGHRNLYDMAERAVSEFSPELRWIP